MILGLDVSTSTIGWCVNKENGDFVDCGYIPLSRVKGLIAKAKVSEKHFNEILIKHEINYVFIEECFQRFTRGMSSAATITKLASFNGIIQYVCFETFGLYPELLNVNQARKSVGLKVISQKKCGISAKEQVLEWVQKDIDFDWPTKVLQSGPRKNQEILLPECYDMADAYVIAKSGYCTLS